MLCDGAVLLDRSLAWERLKTPGEHLGVLIEPDPREIWRTATGGDTPPAAGLRLLDVPLDRLRDALRTRLGLRGPVILTGHQAEFGHAGVFAKTIAVDALVRRLGGSGVFLAVDSDLPKTTHLAVPCLVDGRIRRRFVAIPGCDPSLPMNSQPAVPREAWRGFFAELAGCVERSRDTLLPIFAQGVETADAGPLDFRAVVERGHAAIEHALGLRRPTHVRVSALVRTPAFRVFLAHIALHARAFADAYNAAQRAYRIRHKVRNPQRPAPLLQTARARVELPFWIRRTGQRRRRLFVRNAGGRIEFFAEDRLAGVAEVAALEHAANHADPWPLERDGWQILPRALALSALVRLLLADLFVHGIGGAKYDEMTEDFVLRFWGVRPRAICCISATLFPPLPVSGVTDETLARIRRARRDLHYNPQRYLDHQPSDLLARREALIRASQTLRRERPHDHAARRRVFVELREVNHALLHHDPVRSAALERQWRAIEQQARDDRLARDRELFFALHPRRAIEQLAGRLQAALGGDVSEGAGS